MFCYALIFAASAQARRPAVAVGLTQATWSDQAAANKAHLMVTGPDGQVNHIVDMSGDAMFAPGRR